MEGSNLHFFFSKKLLPLGMKEFLQLASNSVLHSRVHFLRFTKHGLVAVMGFLVTLGPFKVNPYFPTLGSLPEKGEQEVLMLVFHLTAVNDWQFYSHNNRLLNLIDHINDWHLLCFSQ